MKKSHLIPVTYQDSRYAVRVTAYADTVVYDASAENTLCAIRFGGYPESVRALSDGIWGGGHVDMALGEKSILLKSLPKRYRRQLSHDGLYAEATLIADDEVQQTKKIQKTGENQNGKAEESSEDLDLPPDLPPRNVYIFCEPGDRDALFREVDRKTAVPLIPEFRDFMLTELERRGYLKPLTVCSSARPFDAWVLRCEEGDQNIVSVVQHGLSSGTIAIPGGQGGISPLGNVTTVMEYLRAFGSVLAQRIKELFVPLFDPAKEPLSPELLEINDYIQKKAGYSLYDAQLAVAEAVKRRLQTGKVALIIAECGSGKSKIGATAMGALWGLHASNGGAGKTLTSSSAPRT